MRYTLVVLFTALMACAAYGQTVLPGTRIVTQSFTQGVAAPTAYEQFTVLCTADVGGNLSAKYWKFCLPNSGTCYAPWYDVDNGSTPPTVPGHTLVEIDIATGALIGAVGDATQTAVHALAGVSCTDDNAGLVTCTLDAKGPATDVLPGDTGWTVAVLTQGLLGSAAIASGSILPGVLGWRVCNHSSNASTWLAIGQATDPETDGVRIAPATCIDCPSCTPGALGALKVSSQAASNYYTVVQFRDK